MKRLLISLSIMLAALAPATLAVVPAYADCGKDAKGQILTGVGLTGAGCNSGASDVKGLVGTIINILSYIVGVAAVIVIIIAGLHFITANGDSNKIATAKNMLIYALIGLVVVAAAQFLVHFALKTAHQATNSFVPGSSAHVRHDA